MNLTHFTSIVVKPNRQRRAHDESHHQELVASIRQRQLLHPVVLRSEGPNLVLVAGERRLKALGELHELGEVVRCNNVEIPIGQVPYTLLGELDPLEAEEAELEENIRRVDLSWQEVAETEARLLALRQAQARAAGAAILPTVRDVVEELRSEVTPTTQASVARNVVLANNLHRPEVRAAKSATEAYKVLQRAEERQRNEELARGLGKEFLGSKHKLVVGDCVEWLRGQPDATWDVLCCDPPYGMGADEFGDSGGGAAGAHFYDDSEDGWFALMEAWIPEVTRVMKADAHAYVFCDFDKFAALRSQFAVQGWKCFRTPLLWHKPSAFRAPWPEQGPQRKYECLLYAVRGGLKCTKLAPDVLTYPPEENLGHNAQKPVALYADLLSRSVRPGMQVLDPFCGSGPIFPAAHQLKCIATGVEKDEGAAGIAAKRIMELKGG